MIREVADALGTALEAIELDELQVVPRYWLFPTGPSLDVYPAEPSQEDAAFGPASKLTLWTIRARVTTADHQANQDLLLDLMEPSGATSVRQAVLADKTLGGLAEGMDVDNPTGFQAYPAVDGTGTGYLGCEWRVRVYVNGNGGGG